MISALPWPRGYSYWTKAGHHPASEAVRQRMDELKSAGEDADFESLGFQLVLAVEMELGAEPQA